jgi:hypothetical protein
MIKYGDANELFFNHKEIKSAKRKQTHPKQKASSKLQTATNANQQPANRTFFWVFDPHDENKLGRTVYYLPQAAAREKPRHTRHHNTSQNKVSFTGCPSTLR